MRYTFLLAGGVAMGALLSLLTGHGTSPTVNPITFVVAATHSAPTAPAGLRVSAPGGQAPGPHGWTNQAQVALEASPSSPAGPVALALEAEFVPADQSFTGTPNVVGLAEARSVISPVMAAGRQYHWQVRAREFGGKAGPWAAFDGLLGYAPDPPPAPQLTPLPHDGYVTQRRFRIGWSAPPGQADLAGFAVAADQNPAGAPPDRPTTAEPSASLDVAADGDWFVHVRGVDEARHWSATATLR